MITTESLEENLPAGPSAIALGLFDGVHRGHQAVIGAAVAQRGAGLIPCVFTFTTMGGAPESKRDFSLLQTEAQKEKTLERLGVEWVITPDFSRFRGMSCLLYTSMVLLLKTQNALGFAGNPPPTTKAEGINGRGATGFDKFFFCFYIKDSGHKCQSTGKNSLVWARRNFRFFRVLAA